MKRLLPSSKRSKPGASHTCSSARTRPTSTGFRKPDDADFTLDLKGIAIDELGQLLEPTIRIEPELHVEITSGQRRYTARVDGITFNIELFVLNDDPYNQERFRRRQLVDLLGIQVWVPTVEDVIVTKTRWSLLGDRLKFISDIRGVIVVQGDQIDWGYVQRWCKQHGSLDLLDEIRAGA